MSVVNIRGSGTDEARDFAAEIQQQMGKDLKSIQLYDASVNAGGRLVGFRAVVKASAPVNPNLGLDHLALTTALFELSPTQDEEPIGDELFIGQIDSMAGAVPDVSDLAFGAHLLGGKQWIEDNLAVPTLSSVGRTAIVSDESKNSDGESEPRYFVRVTVASDRLTQQGNDHHTMAVINKRTYGQLMSEAAEEIDATTSNQVFGTMENGFPLAAAVMARAAQSAAEAVGEALNLTFKDTRFDPISERTRPRSNLHQVTNIMRPMDNGDVEILSNVVQPCSGEFLFDFGGASSSVIVTNTLQNYVSVSVPLPREVKFEVDYGNRSAASRKRLESKWTWVGRSQGIGTPLLDNPERSYNEEKQARKALWGGDLMALDNKLGKIASHDLRDRPVTQQQLL